MAIALHVGTTLIPASGTLECGLSLLFCFFPVWVTQSTLRLPHLFECACELWHLPAFVSVMCVDVFSVLHSAQICLTFQFKNPNYVQEINQRLEQEERAVLWRHVQVWQTLFFWRGSFFLSFPSVRVGQTPITCPIDLKRKRPWAHTQPAGREGRRM